MTEAQVAGNATYQSAERVLALLKSFDDTRVEQGVTEIARALGVHKSTASRLAAALERTGFLTRTGKRYRLGVEVIRLGTLALRSFDLVATMQPAMEKLSQRTGETVNLAVPDGADVLNVAEVPSTYILSCSGGWIGRRTTPHAVANGKVLLAYGALPPPGTLERYTARTITSAAGLASGTGHGPPGRLRHGGRGAGRRAGRGGRAGLRPGRDVRRGAVRLRPRVPDAARDPRRPGPVVRQRLNRRIDVASEAAARGADEH